MTEEEVALEKLKGLAEKAAARRAAKGQAGKDKHAAGEAKRWAATEQADKDKHAGVEAARWAATGQAGKGKHAAGEAARRAATRQAGKEKHAAGEAERWSKKRLQRLRRSKKRPRIKLRWKSTSTEMAIPGIINACSPPPRRAPDLSSAPHLSSTAPRHCAAQIAPRNCRRTIRAAQPRRHTVQILSRTTSSTTSAYPRPCSVASLEVNSEPHTGARPSVRLCVGPELARCVHQIKSTARWEVPAQSALSSALMVKNAFKTTRIWLGIQI
jgi:hypothetical protein